MCVCVYPDMIFEFKIPEGFFLRDKAYDVKMKVKFVMSTNEQVMMSSDQCSSLYLRS